MTNWISIRIFGFLLTTSSFEVYMLPELYHPNCISSSVMPPLTSAGPDKEVNS
jgi:hypothetical protein